MAYFDHDRPGLAPELDRNCSFSPDLSVGQASVIDLALWRKRRHQDDPDPGPGGTAPAVPAPEQPPYDGFGAGSAAPISPLRIGLHVELDVTIEDDARPQCLLVIMRTARNAKMSCGCPRFHAAGVCRHILELSVAHLRNKAFRSL